MERSDPPNLTELLGRHPPEIIVLIDSLRDLVHGVLPEADEQVDLPDGLIAYGKSMRLRDLALAIVPHRTHVNLQFADGVQLTDPANLLEGTGKRARHVKICSRADVERPELLALAQAQVALKI